MNKYMIFSGDEPFTGKHMKLVRDLRCNNEMTWRGVADYCHDVFGNEIGNANWDAVPFNQLAGEDLCEMSSEYHMEDHNGAPWQNSLTPRKRRLMNIRAEIVRFYRRITS